jgi:hypothetical protein
MGARRELSVSPRAVLALQAGTINTFRLRALAAGESRIVETHPQHESEDHRSSHRDHWHQPFDQLCARKKT